VRFRDFLRVSVVLFGGAATALAVVSVAGAAGEDTNTLVYVAAIWWCLATLAGLWVGRRPMTTPGIAGLLSSARNTNALPELEPGTVLFNRLWSLALVTIIAGAVAFLIPQVPAAATGYTLIAALAWRKQSAAVEAVEGRDGVRFYVDRVSPFKATQLIRTPGFRRVEPPEEIDRKAKTVG
jgi:hypothetical protein